MKAKRIIYKQILLLLVCSAAIYARSEELLIENVTLISGERQKPMLNAYVRVIDGIIVDISSTRTPSVGNVKRIDGNGRFLIPGLIDSHVHIAKVPSMTGHHKKQFPELAAAYLKQQPRSYLYFGYTSLIDLNIFSPKLVDDFNQQPLHPDVYTCGQHLAIANGHGMFEEEPETRLLDNPNFLYDHYQKQKLNSEFDLRKHTPKATVKHIKDRGGICIKTYYENGYGGSEFADYDIPTSNIIKDVVIEARKHNMPTLLHANSWESQRFALLADVDIIAHGMFHWGEYRHSSDVPVAIRSTLKTIAERGIGYQPTLHVIDSQRSMFDPEYLKNPLLTKVFPNELLDWYRSVDGHWFHKRIRQYFPRHLRGLTNKEMHQLFSKYYDHNVQILKVLADYKANLLFATDTIVGQSYANAPGLSGYIDMKAWYKAGVSLKTILQAATINNAIAFNLDDKLSSIEIGKKANLLLLKKNPLKTIEAYNSIDFVFINDLSIPRQTLAADD